MLISVQVSLAVSAWADLAARPAAKVRGAKSTWACIIAINFIGPILYYTRGRQ
ncbi:PLDc N-terminal domain-containing protein [Gordonia terrae]|nr:PLDc N-terminal domain-containing protein [Gordonia terrae]